MKNDIKKQQNGKKMKKWHKWAGLLFSFFFILFALSGIFLNHRKEISSIDLSRNILPAPFHYDNWNNGAIKGSLKLTPDSILLFGGAGIFLTDSTATEVSPYQTGLKNGADNRTIGNLIQTDNGNVFAISTFDLYKLNSNTDKWECLSHQIETEERFSDLETRGDTLVVLSRSHVFLSTYPYTQFYKLELKAPEGYQKKATLFRTIWTFHSGELFGIVGKLFVDFLGLVVITLCITGAILTLFPGLIKRRKKRKKNTASFINTLKSSFKLHNKLGATLLIFLILSVVSGTFLRPPLLITIIRSKVPTIPGTILNSDNPWFDKLRCIRYDKDEQNWILYTSDGFYQVSDLPATPVKVQFQPPVSVMGVNILKKQTSGMWLVGSFGGLFYWHKELGKSFDAYTLNPIVPKRGGPPTFTNAISGYSNDFATGEIVFDYLQGAKVLNSTKGFLAMPEEVSRNSRMSLWHVCLEVHTGRIYFPVIGSILSDLFLFVAGVSALSILLSGYIIYRKKRKRKISS